MLCSKASSSSNDSSEKLGEGTVQPCPASLTESYVVQNFRGKREAVNAIAKLLQPFPPHPMDQQRSPYCHTFLTVSLSYHSKVTPIGKLHTEIIAK